MSTYIDRGEPPRNLDSIVASVADRLNEAVRIEQTRNLLTWTACHVVGEAFAAIPGNLHQQALRELAGRTRRTTRTLSNYLRVYSAVQGMELPDEALGILQYSAVLAVLTEYGDDRGRQIILDIHDGDMSLMQARLQSTLEEIRQARAERRQVRLIDALRDALGDLGRQTGPLTETEQQQVRGIVDTLLAAWNAEKQGDT